MPGTPVARTGTGTITETTTLVFVSPAQHRWVSADRNSVLPVISEANPVQSTVTDPVSDFFRPNDARRVGAGSFVERPHPPSRKYSEGRFNDAVMHRAGRPHDERAAGLCTLVRAVRDWPDM